MKRITLLFLALTGMLNVANAQTTLYLENFEANFPDNTGDWTGPPSTRAGQWIGGKDLVTDLDANMTLRGDTGGWIAYAHTLLMSSTSAAVTIPNINIAGHDNLTLSFANAYYYWNGGQPTPVIEIKSGTGSWQTLTTVAVQQDINNVFATQTIPFTVADNTLPLSIRISHNGSGAEFIMDALKVTGTATLGTESNQLSDNSIKVYPNPFTSEFKVDAINSEGPLQVNVFDVLGRKVATAKSSSNQLSMGSSLKSGAYIVKVEGANAKDSKSFKIIKK